jgi:hypothetical protein
MTRKIYSLKVFKCAKPVLLECMGTLGTNWRGDLKVLCNFLLLASDRNNFNSGV